MSGWSDEALLCAHGARCRAILHVPLQPMPCQGAILDLSAPPYMLATNSNPAGAVSYNTALHTVEHKRCAGMTPPRMPQKAAMRQWKLQTRGRRLQKITKARKRKRLAHLINSMSASTVKERSLTEKQQLVAA